MSKIKKNFPELIKENKATLISVGTNSVTNQLITKCAEENGLAFTTYTENEWATLEEIDQYIQEEDLSKQIINLPVGSNQEFSLDKIQETTIKQVTQMKKLNINEAAKTLKIGRATLYRRLEKYGLDVKKERKELLKKQAA